MRGSQSDAMRGESFRLSSQAAPYDRIVEDNYVKRPMAYVPQIQNPKYNLWTEREIPLQINKIPQIPEISPNAYLPNIMVNSGVVLIPNAGIFRR
jgi:hypothetical protein